MDNLQNDSVKSCDVEVHKWANLEAKSESMAEELILNNSPEISDEIKRYQTKRLGLGITLAITIFVFSLCIRACNSIDAYYLEPAPKALYSGPKY